MNFKNAYNFILFLHIGNETISGERDTVQRLEKDLSAIALTVKTLQQDGAKLRDLLPANEGTDRLTDMMESDVSWYKRLADEVNDVIFK